jgi:two-component system, cell cycle sensor histidine kinase and response regulator CckA
MKHEMLLLPPAEPQTSPMTPTAAPAGDPRLRLLEQRVVQLETACRQAQRALKVSDRRARTVFECVPDPCYLCTFEGVIVDGNRAAEEMTGYFRTELIGQNLFHLNLLSAAGLAQAAATLAANRQGQTTGPVEYTIRRKDGTQVTAEICAHAVRLGNLALVLGTAREVTQRKQARAQLAAFAALGAELASAHTVRQAAEVILAAADHLFGWDACVLDLYDPQTDLLRSALCMDLIEGRRTECTPRNNSNAPSLRAQKVLQEGAQLFSSSAQAEPPLQGQAFGDTSRRSASVMCARIQAGQRSVGLLWLHSHTPHAYTPATLQACQALADHCAGALERIRAQEALSESEANYRLLVERSPDAVFIHVEEKFVYANPAALNLLGATQPEQVLGRSIWDIVPAAYRDLIHHRVRQSTQQEANPLLEQRILRLDGSAVEVEAMGIPFCYQGQRAVQTIMHDISARKRADEQILNQARLLEVAQDAITVQDMSGRIHFWNSGATRLYGWSLEEALERDSDSLLPSVTAPSLAEVRRQVLERGEWAGELRQRTKDQRELTVLSRWTLVRHPDGRPRSLLAVSTDITEKTRLEAQLLRAQRLESIGRLASGIAHDLNNVLTPVMMAVQLLDPSCRDESEREILQTLETCAKRGAGIVQQVLLFARGTEGTRVLLHPKHQLQEMAQIVRETFPKSITLQTTFERDLWPIQADHTQIQQVLMNLCVNARDAMPHGGVLKLQAANRHFPEPQPALHPKALPGRYVVLTVADGGSGIPPEILDKIFDPFFTTKPAGQGTGLGLPTALGIVESHGGFITVTSPPGTGTEFNVYLPAAEAPEVAAPLPRAALQPRGHGELLLVVDDELAIRELVRNTLESFGYRVLSAAGGEEALSQYRQHRSELHAVILDLMMPGLAWKSIVEGLRQLNPAVRIITISGLSTDLAALKAQVPGIAAVLPKPFTPSELLHTIAALPTHPA